MDALNASGVSKRYGGRIVLDGFSLSVGQGGFHALMGPSGSGKSTFLHLAAGLVRADGGTIAIGGDDVLSMSDSAAAKFRRRRIGFVFQSFNLLPGKSVEENVFLPARLDGKRPDRARFGELAAILGIEGTAGRKAGTLSGGEQQRVAIARALFARPDIVLADEPTGNLDARAAKGICALLKSVNEKEKTALLVVTHDPVVAAAADTVHFLRDGAIAASCATEGDPALVSRLYLENCK